MDQKTNKKQLRSHILERRKAIPASEREQYSAHICRHLLENERIASAKTIFAFHPFGDEVDILPFIREAMNRGQEVWLPLALVEQRRLIPYRFTGEHMLRQGVYGIMEPDPEKAEAADVSLLEAVVVPGVAFDTHGGRMGYGGGFYDRFLAGLDTLPFLVGVGFSMQVVEHVPVEPHDIRLDGIVTEKGYFQS
ncbi:5-formyltetrahydrofolate cyclo-ligase [Brevibacillus parabrevis]|uniref:5-formyltetrahydrofolate cyclo-ligase n=1 Tax=Brevibacillus parabrevis TaxID=54914 RepID=UPI0007ABCD9A|nr:5-formyltetrahydrofolate cyclo-ligase [Brevibacillus parabrevis]KZE48437.1 5-formyltetrahydrofolate cyclo-ligase [Brevibacillus parabrevis]